MKKFPKRIYVKHEGGSDGEESWLVAQDTPEGIVDADESLPVAIYELVNIAKATAKTVLK